MRLGILSDVHGNLPALEAVLNKLDRIGYDNLTVLGDFVTAGPHPNEVMEMLVIRNPISVRGNTNDQVLSEDAGWGRSSHPDRRRAQDLLAFFDGSGASVALYGHTHRQVYRIVQDRIVINPGAISWPGPHDRRAAFAIIDILGSGVQATLCRIEYEAERVIDDARSVGYPDVDRLREELLGEPAGSRFARLNAHLTGARSQ